MSMLRSKKELMLFQCLCAQRLGWALGQLQMERELTGTMSRMSKDIEFDLSQNVEIVMCVEEVSMR